MASKRKPEKTRHYRIHLTSTEDKETWKRISARASQPSKYPHEFPMATLGITEDFWTLCNVGGGEGLVNVFRGRWPSYRKYTLEFLSTFKVTRDRRTCIPQSIQFRLDNGNHTLTMEQLCDLFNCHEPDDEVEIDYGEFWSAISIKGETTAFESGNTKSTAIRNPVLRYLHRAITQLIFARVDSGGVSNTELELMWCLLHRRGVNLGVLVTTYFDRIFKRDGGIICCGGLITTMAEHLGVPTEDLHPDMGESFLTYKVLFSMEFLKIDSNGQGFFIQSEGDNFPVPNPYLTKVEGWDNQANWKLNGPIHQRIIQSTPVRGAFQKSNMPRTTPIYDPTNDPNFGPIQPFQGEAGTSYARGMPTSLPPKRKKKKKRLSIIAAKIGREGGDQGRNPPMSFNNTPPPALMRCIPTCKICLKLGMEDGRNNNNGMSTTAKVGR